MFSFLALMHKLLNIIYFSFDHLMPIQVFDPKCASLPFHFRDFFVYLWLVIGGLIGAGATRGAYGVIVIVIGACWSFYRHHSIICVLIAPCLMFWAGVSLNKATGDSLPCIAIGTPVLVYGFCELVAAQVLRSAHLDVALRGPGSVVSWANPPEYVPRLFSFALEMSGAFFVVAGSMGLLYCPSEEGGQLGLAGQVGFIALLIIMGVYLLRRGLLLENDGNEVGDSIAGARVQGLRLRLVGLLLINSAIWFAVPMAAASQSLQAMIIVFGSLVLLVSGCVSMYWRQSAVQRP